MNVSENFSVFQPCGLTDSFGNPATHFPRKKHRGGVFTVWLGPGIHTSANFLAASEGHMSLGPALPKVALNPGYGFLGVMGFFCSKKRGLFRKVHV